MHPLLRHLLVATPLCAVVFLVSSGFFTSWSGRAVSHRPPPPDTDPVVRRVLVVAEDRTHGEHDWPKEVVEAHVPTADASGIPPSKLPDGLARTRKDSFALFFTVTPDEGPSVVVPTTSPRSVGLAALAGVLAVLGLNMVRSGSPFSWEPRGVELPRTLPRALEVPPTPGTLGRPRRAEPGPPPPKPRRGGGRRR
jgi:hypothetical protein